MSMHQPEHQKNIFFQQLSFKRISTGILVKLLNSINFSSLAGRIARSEAARPLYRKVSEMPENWDKAEKISRCAVDLTLAQLTSEGQTVERSEIEELIREIEIQYDRTLHLDTATSLGLIFEQIFEHQNNELPFISADKRDIRHLELLKSHKKKGLGVVYLINHSSHLDEFLVDILWQRLGLGLPVFAAGQNMMAIKSIAKLLMIGSYVVLRQGASRHQMSALYNYCRAISQCGEQQGIFLEAWRGGARSRDGSLRYPKRLVTLRGALDVDTDLVIQPVALSFSAIPEDLPLCARKSSISWVRGINPIKTLLRIPIYPKKFLWKSAENMYGRACISMPRPFLLSELKAEHTLDKSGIHLDEFVALSCIKSIARSKKIMASQITALGLLNARKSGRTDLLESVTREIEKTKAYHQSTFGTPADFEDFILRNSTKNFVKDGLAMLRRRAVVSRWKKDRHGLPAVKNEAALSFYATHADRRLYSPTADQNIVVMGAGNWGFALACLVGYRILEDKKYINASLTIFDPRIEVANEMGLNRNGSGPFSDMLLPKNAFVTSDFSAAFRKASDVIIALKPKDFVENFKKMLETAEQQINVMIATRGLLPEGHSLSYLAARDLVRQSQRRDVQIYALSGPVDPEILVHSGRIKGILAGPEDHMDDLVDLFDRSFVQAFISRDPVGVQTADILARIYAIWISFVRSAGMVTEPVELGYLAAQAAEEACSLAVHLGGQRDTFEAASIPWTATFTSLCLGGLWQAFGQKAGKAVKKGKDPKAIFKKLITEYRNAGINIQAVEDMPRVLDCAAAFQLKMPVMEKAVKTLL